MGRGLGSAMKCWPHNTHMLKLPHANYKCNNVSDSLDVGCVILRVRVDGVVTAPFLGTWNLVKWTKLSEESAKVRKGCVMKTKRICGVELVNYGRYKL